MEKKSVESNKLLIPSRPYSEQKVVNHSNLAQELNPNKLKFELPKFSIPLYPENPSFPSPGYAQVYSDLMIEPKDFIPSSFSNKIPENPAIISWNPSVKNTQNILQPNPNELSKKNDKKDSSLAKIKKKFNENRELLKIKLKNAVKDIENEMAQIDEIENLVTSAFTPSAPKVSTKFSEFFVSTFPEYFQESSQKIKKNEPPSQSQNSNPIIINVKGAGSMYSFDLKEIKTHAFKNFVKGMNILRISRHEFWVIGGNQRVSYIFNFLDMSARPMPRPLLSKSYFAMSYIGSYPAIIGGLLNCSKKSNSVEIFDGEKWVEHSTLNVERSHSNAIKYQGYTYVFGCNGTLTIEKFCDEWTLLSLKLPDSRKYFGVIAFHEGFLLFGGEIDKKKSSKSVFFGKFSADFFEKKNKLSQKFATITSSSAILENNSVYLITLESKQVIEYSLKNNLM